jgi:hypothetical protein
MLWGRGFSYNGNPSPFAVSFNDPNPPTGVFTYTLTVSSATTGGVWSSRSVVLLGTKR